MQAQLDRAIDSALEEKRIVGSVVVVAKDNKVMYSRAAGFADREAQISVKLDSIFRLASLTKPVVATIILMMQDKGLLSVSDRVHDHLPYFTPKMPDGSQPDILLSHLLTHNAGLVTDVTPLHHELAEHPLAGVNGSYRHLGLEQHLQRLAKYPLASSPGTSWDYGLSYDVLGGVIAQIHGGTLEDAVRHYITQPLNMRDTLFGVKDTQRLTKAYADAENEPELMREPHPLPHKRGHTTTFTPSRILDPNVFPAGGAGLAGTAHDFMQFLKALQWGGLISDKSMQIGLEPHIRTELLPPGHAQAYLGVTIDAPEASATPQSAGTFYWGGVFGATWFVDPVANLAVVALTNTTFEGIHGQFATDIRDAVYA